MLARLAADNVDVAERTHAWAHAETCESCAARLHTALLQDDEELKTALLADDDSPTAIHVGGAENKEIERGDTVGRYIVLAELGSGGLGRVYSAFDPELDRKVAIKVLRVDAPHIQGDLMQVRLLREARAMAKLTHPNVVTVHDVGVIGRRVFVAMELVDGLTLRGWVSASSPKWPEIRDVMVQAARGLEAAHKAGLIHRDFKPSNVIVTRDGQAKVLDFGLARGVAGELDNPSLDGFSDEIPTTGPLASSRTLLEDTGEPLTDSNQLLGTPGYIAPEQYEGASLDARVDQFAFCVTLHELLYRRRPYRGKTVADLRAATLAGQVSPPPSQVEVPTWLHEVLLRGLTVDRNQRFADMGELIGALTRDRRVRKRQWRAVAAVALASALVGATAAALWRPEPPAEVRSEVEELVIAARAAAAKSYFVYPPSDDPDASTAYSIVLALEDMHGRAEEIGDEAGAELRAEFADTLLRLGDQYWAKQGGMAFATEYYAAALMFDPDNAHAAERVVMTPGQLALLRSKAAEREFSAGELLAAESLAALAEPDQDKRAERLAVLYSRQDPTSVSVAAALDAVVQQDAQPVVARVEQARGQGLRQSSGTSEPATSRPSAGPSAAAADLDDVTDPSPVDAQPTGGAGPASNDEPLHAGEPRLDPAGTSSGGKQAASKKAAAGEAAYRAGKLDEAERLFHQALDLDRGNVTALSGLAELSFDRGRYRDTVKYGKLAVAKQPNSAKLQLLLGDAYFKIVEYSEARLHYEKAKTLGSDAAESRLARLDSKLGK